MILASGHRRSRAAPIRRDLGCSDACRSSPRRGTQRPLRRAHRRNVLGNEVLGAYYAVEHLGESLKLIAILGQRLRRRDGGGGRLPRSRNYLELAPAKRCAISRSPARRRSRPANRWRLRWARRRAPPGTSAQRSSRSRPWRTRHSSPTRCSSRSPARAGRRGDRVGHLRARESRGPFGGTGLAKPPVDMAGVRRRARERTPRA